MSEGAPIAPWKAVVLARIRRLEGYVELAGAAPSKDPMRDAAIEAATGELKVAREATQHGAGRALINWFTGSDQETAWRAIHTAEAHLMHALPEEMFQGEVVNLAARAVLRLGSKSVRYKAWKKELEKDPADRSHIAVIKREIDEVSDRATCACAASGTFYWQAWLSSWSRRPFLQ